MKNLFKNTETIKLVGIICTVIGCGITIIQDQIKDKEMEQTISEEVKRQLKIRDKHYPWHEDDAE